MDDDPENRRSGSNSSRHSLNLVADSRESELNARDENFQSKIGQDQHPESYKEKFSEHCRNSLLSR